LNYLLVSRVIFPDCLRLEKWEISTVVSNIGIGFLNTDTRMPAEAIV
jgi:hypothetical protein